jgi:omega-amidase
MYVAAVQLDIAWENVQVNHDKVRALLAASPVPKGALVALPEMFATGFSMNVTATAQGDARETEAFLAALAQEHGIFVTAGVVTKTAEGRGLNQSVTFAPGGQLLARYTKIHPFSYGDEDRHYAPGTQVLTFPVGDAVVAPFVCYDLRFPEVFRNAVKQGAQIYTVVANWPLPREAHWLALLQARAIENQAFVIGVNRCGRDPRLAYGGRSQIIDPRGNVLADGGAGEGVVGAEISLEMLLTYRREFPALADMKTGWV